MLPPKTAQVSHVDFIKDFVKFITKVDLLRSLYDLVQSRQDILRLPH
jgi:hypothetical protein